MQSMPAYPLTRTWVGALLAFLVLVVDIIFIVVGQIDLKPGLLIAGLGLAILL